MQCKCIDNSSDNGNFTLGRIYRVKENRNMAANIMQI